MKAGKSLEEMVHELQRQNDTKKDILVDTRRLSMEPFNGVMALNVDSDNVERLGINDIAHRQIGTELKIPAPYYERMRENYPELLAHNVNSWFNREPKNRMVRTLDGQARAFLSDRYRRIDNMDIALTVLPILSKLPDLRVESCELTDQRMYIKAVNPRLEAEVKKGDIVQSGVVISNSEVGLGSVAVYPLIYRLVCTNGMVAQDSGINKRHVGRIMQSDYENTSLFRDETVKADDKAFLMKLEDIVNVVTNDVKFNKVVDNMRAATGVPITNTDDIPHVIELTNKEFGFSKEEGDKILQHLFEDHDYSLFGLANAVTRTAEDVKSYDRASELEATGYEVITMAPALWHRLNAA